MTSAATDATVTGAGTDTTSARRPAREMDLGPLETLLARIREKFDPEQIWLFGSRARGDAATALKGLDA